LHVLRDSRDAGKGNLDPSQPASQRRTAGIRESVQEVIQGQASLARISILLFVSCQASVAQSGDQTSAAHKVVIESFVISGTRAVDTAELADITDSMSGSRFNDDNDESSERVRMQFQDRGYFKAEVEKLDIKVIDPLASPKPIRMEAQVNEGARYRLSTIDFTATTLLALGNCVPISE
jgi:hypothetical protein